MAHAVIQPHAQAYLNTCVKLDEKKNLIIVKSLICSEIYEINDDAVYSSSSRRKWERDDDM